MPSSGAEPPLLSAQLSDVSTLATLLRSVAFCPHAIVTASEDGLEVVTELNRTIQAHAYLYSSLFDKYEFVAPPKRTRTIDGQRQRKRRRAEEQPDPSASSRASPSPSHHRAHPLDGQASTHPPHNESDDDSDDSNPHPADPDDPDGPPSISFEINLHTWLSCLNIYGGANSLRPGPSSRPTGNLTSTSASASSTHRLRSRPSVQPGDDLDFDAAADPPPGGPGGPPPTSMHLHHLGTGHPLALSLSHQPSVTTRCAIATYSAAFLTDLAFDPARLAGQAILPSSVLLSAFSELDPSSSRIAIALLPSPSPSPDADAVAPPTAPRNRGTLTFRAVGDTGEAEMEVPFYPSAAERGADPAETHRRTDAAAAAGGVMEKFVATEASREWWYPFGMVGKVLSCLRSSIKTSLRVDEEGLCSFQFMMPSGKGGGGGPGGGAREEFAFVEVLCVPLDETMLFP